MTFETLITFLTIEKTISTFDNWHADVCRHRCLTRAGVGLDWRHPQDTHPLFPPPIQLRWSGTLRDVGQKWYWEKVCPKVQTSLGPPPPPRFGLSPQIIISIQPQHRELIISKRFISAHNSGSWRCRPNAGPEHLHHRWRRRPHHSSLLPLLLCQVNVVLNLLPV